MAEILTSLVAPAMEELGKNMVATIKRQFNYLCCFNSNIQSLNDEAQKLDNARVGLQMQVDTDRRNTKDVVPEVTAWLDASNEIQVKRSGIEVAIKDVKSGCFAIKSRYLLSRKAKKTAEAINVLRERCNFEQISVSAPPASMAPIPLGTTYEFETRKQIENEIMEALIGRKVNMMGICGMGGVGKTTMAKRIMNKVGEENLFDEVVMAIVSQEVDMLKIQCEIAEFMGLKLEEGSLSARAKKIYDRLMQTKRFLLILDDVWGRLKLEELGIPCESDLREGCTILITSRSRDVLSEMDAQNIYAMKVLSETEAWFLFREKVGTCVDELDLLSIAKEVAEECKGLPLALIAVGRALKDKRNQHNWKCALKQLRSANPIDMPHVLAEVYNPIKLSYDFLDNQRARSLFLLCCLFPEDHDIHVDYLTSYGIGLRMFEDIRNLEEARDIVHVLLEILKSCFLLLDGRSHHHVKMHDVVRDVAIFIASNEGHLNLKIDYSREQSINCTWISVVESETSELPIQLSFPSLRLLVLNNSVPKKVPQINNPCFFQGMKELNVLAFNCILFRSLPPTIELLQNLRTLYLLNCWSLETISIVGELLSLEILICRDCIDINELPVEIGRLNRLKLLEVSNCERLKRIVPGVISNLVQLEELKIVGSFVRWETKGNEKQGNNASIGELEFLPNLTRLVIEIEDTTLAAEEICLPLKMVIYNIRLATRRWIDYGRHKKTMHLELEKNTLGKWIQVFLRSTENLHVKGDGSNHLDLAQAQNMKMLIYRDCSTVTKLITSVDWSTGIFSLLEYLYLSGLHNLEEICDGPIPNASNSFGNLKELTLLELPALLHIWKSPYQDVSLCNLSSVDVVRCGKLHRLFSLTRAKDGLLQLENLQVVNCEMMEEVFSNEENEKDEDRWHITFPKLKDLYLRHLPRLTTFCKGSESIEFPLLHSIDIRRCPKLTSLLSCTWDSLNSEGHDGDSFHVFCNQKVSFGSLQDLIIQTDVNNIWCNRTSPGFFSQLEKLAIYDCSGIKSLFSSSIAENLFNLKSLAIHGCKEMVTVIEDEEILRGKHLQFPSLMRLELSHLSKLQSFFRCTSDLYFWSLEVIYICDCPLLEFLTPGSVTLGSLKEMYIEEYDHISSIWWWRQFPLEFFSQLELLQITGCKGIKSFFTYSIAGNLVNLKKLSIRCCNEIIKVIEDEEILCEKPLLLFPSLKELEFRELPKLQSFGGRCDLHLPYLERVSFKKCPSLEFLTMGTVSTPNLEVVIDTRLKTHVRDINGAIQLHFEEMQKESCEIEERDLNGAIQLYFEEMQKESCEIEEEEFDEESSTSAEAKEAEADHKKGEIEDEEVEEEINEESISSAGINK